MNYLFVNGKIFTTPVVINNLINDLEFESLLYGKPDDTTVIGGLIVDIPFDTKLKKEILN